MHCRSKRFSGLVILALIAGCGDGDQRYPISGSVTFNSRPIELGAITFEPLEGEVTKETMAFAAIRQGRYQARVVGGPHKVSIRDLAHEPEAFGLDIEPSSPLFRYQYTVAIDLPAESSGAVAYDFEVPPEHEFAGSAPGVRDQ
jgi:hypothetical protein